MQNFGLYEVIGRVASGSTATVFKTRHRELDRLAAVKQLHGELVSDTSFVAGLRAEAALLASFDSPHLVTVYDFVEEPGQVWLAEEWVDGATVDELLRSAGSLAPEQSLGVLRGALLGLAYAHARDVMHGDIATGNIIADTDGTSRLIDFGISAPIGSGHARGTPAFVSPEVIRGEPAARTADVYSAGAVLYTLLTGRTPFPASDVDAVLRHHLETPAPRLSDHGPLIEQLLADALAKDPSSRPPDAQAFLDRLEDAARRRFGADWLTRASVSGLVLSALAGTAGELAAAGGAEVATAGATAVGDVHVSTGRRTRPRVLLGAAAVVAVIAGVIVAIVASSGDDSVEPIRSRVAGGPAPGSTTATVSSSPSSTESAGPHPTGRYRITGAWTSSSFPAGAQFKVGPITTRIWTIDLTCPGSTCTGVAHSSSGADYPSTFGPGGLTGMARAAVSGPCQVTSGPKTGRILPGSHFDGVRKAAFSLKVVRRSAGPTPAAGVPVLLEGPVHVTEVDRGKTAGCSSATFTATGTWILTYVGA